MRLILILLIFIFPVFLKSQTRDKRSAPFTIRCNIGIPKSSTSKMFKTSFNGVYEGNLSVNVRLFSTFFVGAGYQNSHFQNNKGVFVYYQAKDPNGNATGATLSYNTRMIGHGAFIKIGYDKFFEKGFVTYALNAGYMKIHYINVINDSAAANLPLVPTKYSAPYLQPELSVSFLADRSLTFSLMFSYTTLLTKFDPKGPRFNAVEQVRSESNKYFISWINIGFGISVLLGDR